MSFGAFVGVIVPEDGVSSNFSEMEAIAPSTWVRGVCRLSDGNVNDVAVFDILSVFDRRVGRHPTTYGILSIGISLWTGHHRIGFKNGWVGPGPVNLPRGFLLRRRALHPPAEE